MASIDEAIRRLIFQYVSEGADKVMQTQEAVAASTTKTDKASLSLDKSFGNLERRYVDTVRHQQDYAKVQAQVNAAVAQNPALQERANVVLAAASQHFDNLAANASKGGIAMSFFSKAISVIIGPAGLIGAGLAAAAAGVVYLVEKFQIIPQVLNLIAAGLASIGFGQAAQSVADYGQRMREVKEAAELQKKAIAEIKAIHPAISDEVAKELQLMEAQLKVAQAITEEEKKIAQYNLEIVQGLQKNLSAREAALIAADKQKIADAQTRTKYDSPYYSQNATDAANKAYADNTRAVESSAAATNSSTAAVSNLNDTTRQNTSVVLQQNQVYDRLTGHILDYTDSIIFWARTLEQAIDDVLDMMGPSQFKAEGYEFSYDPLSLQRKKQAYEDAGTSTKMKTHGIPGTLGAFQYAVRDYGDVFDTPFFNELEKSVDENTKSTDRLNETMQNALSPFYSQDPRTTKLGFRAGVTGNPDWATGATNANPLVAVLGAGATAPGMADGGSFVVGGGYSANDNKMAVFPVASGEEIVVNRNKEGSGGQIVNIDNRIIVQGNIDEDTLSKMKVSRFQQAQRMRAGMAQAS